MVWAVVGNALICSGAQPGPEGSISACIGPRVQCLGPTGDLILLLAHPARAAKDR